MATKRDGQRWVLDALISSGGWNVLHPEAGHLMQQLGYHSADIERIFGQVKSTAHIKMAFSTVAQEVETKALYWLERGFHSAAANLLTRAMLLYGRAYYSFFGDDPRRKRFLACQRRCYDRLVKLQSHKVERLELDFEDKRLYGILQAPANAAKLPCVIVIGGMDMVKEDWHHYIAQSIVPRGWVGFTFDGPGQGESLTLGLKAKIDNYETAMSRVIDALQARPEIDPDRIVLLATSMGSWWGSRAAAREKRLKAVAINMPCYGGKHVIFNLAQPNYKANFMYMAGINDEDEFDRYAAAMDISAMLPDISCPFLMVTGEYDELTTLEDTLAAYRTLTAPKELWVYGYEFHPIGPPAAEWLPASLDWLERALDGAYGKGYAKGIYITRDGRYREGSGEPDWWHPRE
ncbi:MAG: alpha/beta hydrolase family protein [Burkholderiales bacterium]